MMTRDLICYVLFYVRFIVTTCDLIYDHSTEQYPLNKKQAHILNNREAYYYYYYDYKN